MDLLCEGNIKILTKEGKKLLVESLNHRGIVKIRFIEKVIHHGH
jgi:hypothetical protein